MNRFLVLIVAAVAFCACHEDGVSGNGNGSNSDCYDGGCTTRAMPFSDSAGAPTLTEVVLECESHAVVVNAIATDPQGDADLQDVLQTIGVFVDIECAGTAIEVQDDFVGSGVSESFGDAVVKASNPALYDQICGCNSWPVEVQLEDKSGNSTSGRTVAQVIR